MFSKASRVITRTKEKLEPVIDRFNQVKSVVVAAIAVQSAVSTLGKRLKPHAKSKFSK